MSPAATATKQGRWFSGGRGTVREAPLRVLTASATRLDLTNRKEARRQRALRQGWQLEAWGYRAAIGELRYAVNFLANCMARMRIFPAAYQAGGESDNPLPLTEIENVPPEIIAACAQAMLDLGNGKLAMAGLLHSLSTNISVPGESFLLGQEDPMTGLQSWSIRSVSEIVVYDDQYKLREVPMDPQGILGWIDLDPALTVASRMWVPDPQFRILADSPLKAIMDDCESLLILRRMIRATGRSRLAGRGLLLIPNELSINVPTDDDDHGDSDPFMAALTEAMVASIADEGVASSVVPSVVRGPGDTLAQVRLLEFASQFDEMSSKTREELVGIIATGFDLPKEVITGVADLNHWSAWAVDDNTFRHHVEPHVITGVDMLTAAYLRPYIANCDLDPLVIEAWTERLVLWYDPTELVTHPDQTADALNLHDRLVISNEALLRTAGFSDADAPEADEYMARLISKQRAWPANLTMGVIHDIDPELIVPPMTGPPAIPGIKPGGVDIPVAPALPGAAPTDTTAPADVTTPAPTPPVQPPEPGPPPITASAKPKPSAKALRLSRKLSAIDADLRARLSIAANAAMLHQLNKAGGKLRSKVAKDETLRTRIAHHRNEQVGAVLGEPIVAAAGLSAAELMGTSWDGLKAQYMEWTGAAQLQALKAAQQLAGIADDDAALATARTAMATSLDAGWTLLSDAMTTMSHSLLFNPTGDVDPASFNPDTLVPTGTIRASLGVAGGADASTFTVTDDGLAAVDLGTPIGQVGTGATVGDLLSGAGQAIASYTWEHGPSLKPFEPHEELDGVEFVTFDDDVLANNGDFPDNAYFVPGDHNGCFPAGTIASGPRAAGATLRHWQGEMIEVGFASGQFLTATPNHPILTPHGWIPMGRLDEGDEVVRCMDGEGITRLVPNNYQVPTRIEEIADAVGVTSGMVTRTVEVAPEHFHGDGIGSEIAVVRTDGDLRDRLDAALGQPLSELSLTGANPMIRVGLATAGGAGELVGAVGDAALSRVGSDGAGHAPLGGRPLVSESSRILDPTPLDASGDQAFLDGATVDTERIGQSLLGLTGLVSPDKILNIKRYPFSGHVFNLDTRVGWYIADGILVHNCSCDFTPIYADASTVSDTGTDSGDTSEGES